MGTSVIKEKTLWFVNINRFHPWFRLFVAADQWEFAAALWLNVSTLTFQVS